MLSAPKPISRMPQEGVTPARGIRARSRATRPASITTPDSMALIPLGAWEWASGSQVCMGTMAIFTPNPITNSAPAASIAGEPTCVAIRILSRFSVPVWARTRAIPSRTSTEPSALCTRYFMPASSEAGCSR